MYHCRRKNEWRIRNSSFVGIMSLVKNQKSLVRFAHSVIFFGLFFWHLWFNSLCQLIAPTHDECYNFYNTLVMSALIRHYVSFIDCGSCVDNTAIILLKLAKRQIFCLQNYCFIWSRCCSDSHVTHSTARHLWLRPNQMALMSRDTKYRGQDRAGSDISQSDTRSQLSFVVASLQH